MLLLSKAAVIWRLFTIRMVQISIFACVLISIKGELQQTLYERDIDGIDELVTRDCDVIKSLYRFGSAHLFYTCSIVLSRGLSSGLPCEFTAILVYPKTLMH